MPEQKEYEVKVTWENNNFFKMEEKVPGGDWLTIVFSEENTNVSVIAGQLLGLCVAQFNENISKALEEMKKP